MIGKLDKRIDILEKVVTRDDYGAEVVTYQVFKSLWAKQEKNKSGDDNKEISGRQTPHRNILFTIRYCLGITEDMKIRFSDELGDKHYKIISVNEKENTRRKSYIDIEAEKFNLDYNIT
jgi:SPP1 family predicted phage head-tail adaptor